MKAKEVVKLVEEQAVSRAVKRRSHAYGTSLHRCWRKHRRQLALLLSTLNAALANLHAPQALNAEMGFIFARMIAGIRTERVRQEDLLDPVVIASRAVP